MACAVQQQFCNSNLPEGSRCTPLSGEYDLADSLPALFQNGSEADLNRATWVYAAVFAGDLGIDEIVSVLGSQSLTARDSLTLNMQGPLPDDQWQLEVQHWHETSLAAMQAFFINTAAGPNDERVQEWFQKPNNTQEAQLCGSQVRTWINHPIIAMWRGYLTRRQTENHNRRLRLFQHVRADVHTHLRGLGHRHILLPRAHPLVPTAESWPAPLLVLRVAHEPDAPAPTPRLRGGRDRRDVVAHNRLRARHQGRPGSGAARFDGPEPSQAVGSPGSDPGG